MSSSSKLYRWLFLYSAALSLFVPPLFPSLHLTFFAPLIGMSLYRLPLHRTLWMAIAGGFLHDLQSSHTHFGIYGTAYALATFAPFQIRRHFFEDSLWTLPVMAALFSGATTFILSLLLRALEQPLPITRDWIVIDFILFSCLDGIMAFIFFTLPPLLLGKRPQPSHRFQRPRPQ